VRAGHPLRVRYWWGRVGGVFISVLLGACASGGHCPGVAARDPGAAATALAGRVQSAVRTGALEVQGHVVQVGGSRIYGSCSLVGAPCMARVFLRRGAQSSAANVFYWNATASVAPVFEVRTIEYRFSGSAVVLRDGMRWPLAARFSGCIRNVEAPQEARDGVIFRVDASTGTALSNTCFFCD
jgi:hypothetical protein